jgi:hypothetical protein
LIKAVVCTMRGVADIYGLGVPVEVTVEAKGLPLTTLRAFGKAGCLNPHPVHCTELIVFGNVKALTAVASVTLPLSLSVLP